MEGADGTLSLLDTVTSEKRDYPVHYACSVLLPQPCRGGQIRRRRRLSGGAVTAAGHTCHTLPLGRLFSVPLTVKHIPISP